MAEHDIYLVREKSDGSFAEISGYTHKTTSAQITNAAYDALAAADPGDGSAWQGSYTSNMPMSYTGTGTLTFNTALKVPELLVEGDTTIVHTNTTTSERLSITNDGTGPALFINQIGSQPILDIQDDGYAALFIKDGGDVGIGKNDPATKLDVNGIVTWTGGNSTNANLAYGWGDHNTAGYATENQTITLTGDASGAGKTSIAVVVADDSHNHTGSSGDFTIGGNLTVNGTTTTINTATLDVEDLNITVAKGSASAAAANGAGLTVDGAGATLLYNSTLDAWSFNKKVGIGTGSPSGDLELLSTNTDTNFLMGGTPTAGTREPWRIQAEGDKLHIGQNKSSYAKYMTFKGNNVGIGTIEPFAPLHVRGPGDDFDPTELDGYNLNLGGTLSGDTIIHTLVLDSETTPGAGIGPSISFRGRSGDGLGSSAFATIIGAKENAETGSTLNSDTATSAKGYLGFYTASTYKFTPDFGTEMVEAMRISSGGNVGIGTDQPGAKLDISTNSTTGLRLINPDAAGANLSNDPPAILFQANGWDTDAGSRAYSGSIGVKGGYSGAADRGNTHPVIHFDLETNEDNPDDALSTKMVINAAGNVGIGNTNPASKLSLHGSTDNDASGYENRLAFYQHADGTRFRGIGMFHNGEYATPTGFGVGIWAGTGAGTAPTSANPKFVVTDGGNVGIGTSSPAGALHIVNPSANTLTLTRQINILGIADGAVAKIEGGALSAASPSMGAALGFSLVDVDGDGGGPGNTKGHLYFETKEGGASLTEKMRITSDGNVGIGTDAPHSNLTVASTYTAQLSLTSKDTSIEYGQEIGAILGEGYDSNTLDAGNALTNTPFTGAKIAFRAGAVDLNGQNVDWNTGVDHYWPTSIDFHTQAATANDDIAAGPRMTIASDGNVGIGTDKPEQKLHLVDGVGVFQRDLDITTGWGTHVALRNESLIDNVAVGLDFQGLDTDGVLRTAGRISTKITSHAPTNNMITSRMCFGLGSYQELMVIEQDGRVLVNAEEVLTVKVKYEYSEADTVRQDDTNFYVNTDVNATLIDGIYEVYATINNDAGQGIRQIDVLYGKVVIGSGGSGGTKKRYVNYVRENPQPRDLYESNQTTLNHDITPYLVQGGAVGSDADANTGAQLRLTFNSDGKTNAGTNLNWFEMKLRKII
jgi:hypothetical protein